MALPLTGFPFGSPILVSAVTAEEMFLDETSVALFLGLPGGFFPTHYITKNIKAIVKPDMILLN